MMKFFSVVATFCLLLTFNSCKKCYECSDTCGYCIYPVSGGQVFTPTYCSSDEGDDYEMAKAGCPQLNGTWVLQTADQTEAEICAKPKDAEKQVEEYERNGYTCTDK